MGKCTRRSLSECFLLSAPLRFSFRRLLLICFTAPVNIVLIVVGRFHTHQHLRGGYTVSGADFYYLYKLL